MKAVIAILFTVLYIVFSCFAVTSAAASTYSYNTCKNAIFSIKEIGEINTDNSHDSCTHKPAVTAHVIQKQATNLAGGRNKSILLSMPLFQKYLISKFVISNSNELYFKAVAPLSYPLFIKNCSLLI